MIKVDLHLKRKGVEQLRSLWAFSDCNLRFSLEVKWFWTGVCASQIESFNYFSVAIWFSACVVFMTISQFWQAKAKYWSHKRMPSNSWQFEGKRWTRQINWNEIIILQSITLTVDIHAVMNPVAVKQTHPHAQTHIQIHRGFEMCILPPLYDL